MVTWVGVALPREQHIFHEPLDVLHEMFAFCLFVFVVSESCVAI